MELTAAASAADARIHKKISGHNTTLIISNDEMEDISKIVKPYEESGLLLEGVSETIKSEAKEQKGGFLRMLLGRLGTKVNSTFKDNIWGADLADMQLISKFSKVFRFLLCVIDIFSKYPWVFPLKDKKGVSIVNAFQSILKKSNRKPNKIWVDKRSEFYNSSFKKWLQDNDIVMYSTQNEG